MPIRYVLIALLLATCSVAVFAQDCLPATEVKPADPSMPQDGPSTWVQPEKQAPGWFGSPMRGGVTLRGAWVRWHCAELGTGRVRTVTYVGTVAEFSRIGSRLQTIVNAADPLKSLQTLPSRITVLPLTDPSLAGIVGDVNAGAK